jgi:hypothetical protein
MQRLSEGSDDVGMKLPLYAHSSLNLGTLISPLRSKYFRQIASASRFLRSVFAHGGTSIQPFHDEFFEACDSIIVDVDGTLFGLFFYRLFLWVVAFLVYLIFAQVSVG